MWTPSGNTRFPLPLLASAWSLPLHLATGASAIVAFVTLWLERYQLARIAAASQVSVILWGWALTQYPYAIRSHPHARGGGSAARRPSRLASGARGWRRRTAASLVVSVQNVRPASPAEPLSTNMMSHLELVALVVREYDPAIDFFVNVLQFELISDVPSLTNDGRPKRWVVVRPKGGVTGILLARADGDQQAAAVGKQFAGRVGFFLRVDDFAAAYERMMAAGVVFVSPPRLESYGRVAVFLDLEGNRWDLLGS